MSNIGDMHWTNHIRRYYKIIIAFTLIVIIMILSLFLYRISLEVKMMNNFAKYMKATSSSSEGGVLEGLHNLEELSNINSIISDIAKIKLASVYFSLAEYNKAAYYYGLSYLDQNIMQYAKMMAVLVQRKANKLSNRDSIEYLSKIDKFGSMTSLVSASILISDGKKNEARIILDNAKVNNPDLSNVADLLLMLCV